MAIHLLFKTRPCGLCLTLLLPLDCPALGYDSHGQKLALLSLCVICPVYDQMIFHLMNPISPADLVIPHAIKNYSGAWTPSIPQPHLSHDILRSPKGGWCFLRSFLSWVNTCDQLLLSPEFSSISGSFSFLPPYCSPKLWPWALFSLGSHTGWPHPVSGPGP